MDTKLKIINFLMKNSSIEGYTIKELAQILYIHPSVLGANLVYLQSYDMIIRVRKGNQYYYNLNM